MKISGYSLVRNIKQLELARDADTEAFEDSIYKFPEEAKELPQEIMSRIQKAERDISVLQTVQLFYNTEVMVNVENEEFPLAEAIKRMGGAQRVEGKWRSVSSEKKETMFMWRERMTRKNDETQQVRTISAKEALTFAQSASDYVAKLREAIAKANATEVEFEAEWLDESLFARE